MNEELRSDLIFLVDTVGRFRKRITAVVLGINDHTSQRAECHKQRQTGNVDQQRTSTKHNNNNQNHVKLDGLRR